LAGEIFWFIAALKFVECFRFAKSVDELSSLHIFRLRIIPAAPIVHPQLRVIRIQDCGLERRASKNQPWQFQMPKIHEYGSVLLESANPAFRIETLVSIRPKKSEICELSGFRCSILPVGDLAKLYLDRVHTAVDIALDASLR
jgi:hypothetical protein